MTNHHKQHWSSLETERHPRTCAPLKEGLQLKLHVHVLSRCWCQMSCLHVCLYSTYKPDTCGGPKWASDPMELELWMVMSHLMELGIELGSFGEKQTMFLRAELSLHPALPYLFSDSISNGTWNSPTGYAGWSASSKDLVSAFPVLGLYVWVTTTDFFQVGAGNPNRSLCIHSITE